MEGSHERGAPTLGIPQLIVEGNAITGVQKGADTTFPSSILMTSQCSFIQKAYCLSHNKV